MSRSLCNAKCELMCVRMPPRIHHLRAQRNCMAADSSNASMQLPSTCMHACTLRTCIPICRHTFHTCIHTRRQTNIHTYIYIHTCLPYITLPYLTLPNVTLHYITFTLHYIYITLHYITLHYITLHYIYIPLYYITLRYMHACMHANFS